MFTLWPPFFLSSIGCDQFWRIKNSARPVNQREREIGGMTKKGRPGIRVCLHMGGEDRVGLREKGRGKGKRRERVRQGGKGKSKGEKVRVSGKRED